MKINIIKRVMSLYLRSLCYYAVPDLVGKRHILLYEMLLCCLISLCTDHQSYGLVKGVNLRNVNMSINVNESCTNILVLYNAYKSQDLFSPNILMSCNSQAKDFTIENVLH